MYGFGKMGSTILGSMSDLSLAGGAQTRRRPRKLTILLHPPEYAVRHVGGVNALALAPNYGGAGADQLYTGGRDGTVRAWNVDGDVSEPTCAGTMEGHSSWVNALATVRSSSGAAVLLSGSSDRTVKAWALDGREGSGRDRCVSRVERHADYVTRLAAPTAPGATRFASAGLGGDQVYLWDIEAVARPAASAPRDDAALVRAMEGQTDSAYALAMDATGTTIVSGCSAGTVRVWDVRDSSAPVKLRGHSGNARGARGDGSHGKIVHHGVERRDDPPVGRRPAAVRADHGQRPPPRRRGVERRDGRELARGVQRRRGWTRPRHGRREATNRAALPRTRGGD